MTTFMMYMFYVPVSEITKDFIAVKYLPYIKNNDEDKQSYEYWRSSSIILETL